MVEHLDKSALQRLNALEPAIDPDVLADTLCDGELLAVALDRWVVCDFFVAEGILWNRSRGPLPPPERIAAAIAKHGLYEAESRLTERFDFQILNDPACPPTVLLYLLRALAMLWEAQARRDFPERDVHMELRWNPDEGFGAYSIVQRSQALSP